MAGRELEFDITSSGIVNYQISCPCPKDQNIVHLQKYITMSS